MKNAVENTLDSTDIQVNEESNEISDNYYRSSARIRSYSSCKTALKISSPSPRSVRLQSSTASPTSPNKIKNQPSRFLNLPHLPKFQPVLETARKSEEIKCSQKKFQFPNLIKKKLVNEKSLTVAAPSHPPQPVTIRSPRAKARTLHTSSHSASAGGAIPTNSQSDAQITEQFSSECRTEQFDLLLDASMENLLDSCDVEDTKVCDVGCEETYEVLGTKSEASLREPSRTDKSTDTKHTKRNPFKVTTNTPYQSPIRRGQLHWHSKTFYSNISPADSPTRRRRVVPIASNSSQIDECSIKNTSQLEEISQLTGLDICNEYQISDNECSSKVVPSSPITNSDEHKIELNGATTKLDQPYLIQLYTEEKTFETLSSTVVITVFMDPHKTCYIMCRDSIDPGEMTHLTFRHMLIVDPEAADIAGENAELVAYSIPWARWLVNHVERSPDGNYILRLADTNGIQIGSSESTDTAQTEHLGHEPIVDSTASDNKPVLIMEKEDRVTWSINIDGKEQSLELFWRENMLWLHLLHDMRYTTSKLCETGECQHMLVLTEDGLADLIASQEMNYEQFVFNMHKNIPIIQISCTDIAISKMNESAMREVMKNPRLLLQKCHEDLYFAAHIFTYYLTIDLYIHEQSQAKAQFMTNTFCSIRSSNNSIASLSTCSSYSEYSTNELATGTSPTLVPYITNGSFAEEAENTLIPTIIVANSLDVLQTLASYIAGSVLSTVLHKWEKIAKSSICELQKMVKITSKGINKVETKLAQLSNCNDVVHVDIVENVSQAFQQTQTLSDEDIKEMHFIIVDILNETIDLVHCLSPMARQDAAEYELNYQRYHARKLQSLLRMVVQRKKYNNAQCSRHRAAQLIQALKRGAISRQKHQHRNHQARKLQAVFRMIAQRRKYIELKSSHNHAAQVVQSLYRGCVAKQVYKRKRKSIRLLQSCVRMFIQRKKYGQLQLSRHQAAQLIQAHQRTAMYREKYKTQKYKIRKLQSFIRMIIQRRKYKNLSIFRNRAAQLIQAQQRGILARQEYQLERKNALKLQSAIRMFAQRKKYNDLRMTRYRAVQLIQARQRGIMVRYQYRFQENQCNEASYYKFNYSNHIAGGEASQIREYDALGSGVHLIRNESPSQTVSDAPVTLHDIDIIVHHVTAMKHDHLYIAGVSIVNEVLEAMIQAVITASNLDALQSIAISKIGTFDSVVDEVLKAMIQTVIAASTIDVLESIAISIVNAVIISVLHKLNSITNDSLYNVEHFFNDEHQVNDLPPDEQQQLSEPHNLEIPAIEDTVEAIMQTITTEGALGDLKPVVISNMDSVDSAIEEVLEAMMQTGRAPSTLGGLKSIAISIVDSVITSVLHKLNNIQNGEYNVEQLLSREYPVNDVRPEEQKQLSEPYIPKISAVEEFLEAMTQSVTAANYRSDIKSIAMSNIDSMITSALHKVSCIRDDLKCNVEQWSYDEPHAKDIASDIQLQPSVHPSFNASTAAIVSTNSNGNTGTISELFSSCFKVIHSNIDKQSSEGYKQTKIISDEDINEINCVITDILEKLSDSASNISHMARQEVAEY